MNKIKYTIAKDYTLTPGGRYKEDGNFSGEEFREKELIPLVDRALEEKRKIEIDLDGVFGYATSFLDESFGVLAKIYKEDNLKKLIEFKSEDRVDLKDKIYEYMDKHINEDR